MQTSKRLGKRNNTSSVAIRNTRGYIFRPPLVPQVFSLTPFNNALIRIREGSKTSWNITFGDVHAVMTKQLGFTNVTFSSEGGFEVKLQSISVWNVRDENTDLTLVARDPSGTSTTELARVDSMGMKNMYARCGYSYPITVSSSVFHTVKDGSKHLATVYSSMAGFEVHIKLLWRGAYFSVSSTLGYEDFKNLCKRKTSSIDDKQTGADDIDAEIDEMECKLRILELRRIKLGSSANSAC